MRRPTPGDPLTAQRRAQRTAVAVLGAGHASSRPPTSRGGASSAICTTAPSSGSRTRSSPQAGAAALGDDAEPVGELLAEALGNAQRGLDDMRELARGIHPRILSSGGLAPALESLASACPVPVTLGLPASTRLDERVEVTAYFVVSEALANAAELAGASTIHVAVSTGGGRLRLSITDDGVGGANPARGSGWSDSQTASRHWVARCRSRAAAGRARG